MRKLGLVTAIGLAGLSLSGQVIALGLGEIEVKSFLNQPLQAEIEVISARPGEIDDLLVTLASRDAFSRAGLSRPRHLSDLRFEVQKSESGDSAVVLVTTQQSVKEPFLNFLIEADWSKGRVLREFTVLLDPPFYADTPQPADTPTPTTDSAEPEAGMVSGQAAAAMSEESAQAVTPQPQPIATLEEDDSSTGAVADTSTQSSASMQASELASGAGEITTFVVDRGDTLWGIASQVKSDEHSMGQIMLAFQRANPQAFGDGNINNLKVGSVLRVPDINEIEALSKQEAYAQVLEQNGLWDEYVARVSGIAPSVAADATEAEGEPTMQDGELSLVMPSEGEVDASDSGQVDELRTKLALTEEELDAARIENAELESRISELQARLDKLEELQGMVEIEDDSLAQLQADQQQEVVESVEEPTIEPVLSDEMAASEEELLEELLAEEAEAQQAEEMAAAEMAAADDGMVDDEPVADDTVAADSMVEEAAPDDMMTDDSMAADDTAAAADDGMMEDEAVETVEPPPAPVIVTAPSQPTSGLAGLLPPAVAALIPAALLANPLILAGVGGLVILLLVLVLLKRRKSSKEDESSILEDDGESLVDDDEEELTPIHLAEPQEKPDTYEQTSQTEVVSDSADTEVAVEPAEEEDEFARTAIISGTDMPAPEAPAAVGAGEQDDVLNEADVYLAYGLYDNAVDLLSSNLEESPDRADYRAKLLDTHFATKNADAFVTEAGILKSMGDASKPYWDRVMVMGYELAPDNDLFSEAKDSTLSAADLEIAKPQEADFDLGVGDDDEDETNFSITDFNLAEETGGDFSETSEVGADESEELLDLDNLSDLAEQAPADLDLSEGEPGEPNEDEDGLDFALPDDLDLAAETEEAVADEISDLDLGDSAAEEAPALDLDTEDADVGEVALDIEDRADDLAPHDDDEVEIEFDEEPKAPEYEETAIVDTTPGYEETAVIESSDLAADEDDDISRLDLGTDDTSEVEEESDDDDSVILDAEAVEDDLDISLGDFSEPEESDEDAKTGTFAPGDFDEPAAEADSAEDIEDMMLPDDVDEVSTKLDLARAFIDMGDVEGAKGSLQEVLAEGNDEQKAEAQSLLDQL